MSSHFLRKFQIIFILFFVSSLVGCDQIKAISQYFKKPKDTQPSAVLLDQPSATTQGVKQPAGSMPENVLARIGSWSITLDEFNERLEAIKKAIPDYKVDDLEAKKIILEELVRQQLLVMDAESSGVSQQKDIKEAVEEFRRTLLVRELANKLTENITVADEEAQAFYNEKKDLLKEPEQYHVREIVIDDEAAATQILKDLLDGADFSEKAKASSKSKSALNGGDLGFIVQAPFPQMGNALLSMEKGKISSVFKGPDGFYIVKLEEIKEGKQLAFDEIKNEIIQNRKLFKQQQVVLDYIDQLKQKIKVETNEKLLE